MSASAFQMIHKGLLRSRCVFALSAILLGAAFPTLAHAAGDAGEVQRNLNFVWTMIAAGLVFFMQMGFLLLEAGLVRAKNAVNVAQKNLLDFTVSSLLFGAIGFAFMFGPSVNGWIGWSWDLALWNIDEPWVLTFFVFQMVFCGTAATIVSGAVAERMSMAGYVGISALLAAIVYPIAGHWSWGGLLTGDDAPFLASWGFMDFAGSTVVHSVGAWAGLAAAIFIGPRDGKYDDAGKPRNLHGHSPVLATGGALIIWVGWIGFNGGSTTAGTPAFAGIIANTMAAGVAGTVVHMLLGRLGHGYFRPEFMINGALSGLVGITAGCDVVSLQSALMMGALASAVCYMAREALEHRGVDDPLGAVAVHGFAGLTGTILVGVFAPVESLLAADRITQIALQAAGVGIYFVWTFGLVYVGLWILKQLLPCEHDGPGGGLRVTPEAERIGLNAAEHNAPLGMASLIEGMSAIAQDPDRPIDPIPEEPGEESYDAAVLFNRILSLLDRRAKAEARRAADIAQTLKELGEAISRAEQGDLSGRISADPRSDFAAIADAFNSMLEKLGSIIGQVATMSDVLTDVAQRMTAQSANMERSAQGQVEKVASLAKVLSELRQSLETNSERVHTAQAKMRQNEASSQSVRESSAAMVQRIEDASEGMRSITSSVDRIDDIALQTHLLSLNASVEAARASGQTGSGFAVVAQEVRNLANSSAENAQSVRHAMQDVVRRTEDARAEVSGTDAALDTMLALSTELGDIIDALGKASLATRDAIDKVSETINDVEASSVDVLAEAAETEGLARSLEDQSVKSNNLLGSFAQPHQSSQDREADKAA